MCFLLLKTAENDNPRLPAASTPFIKGELNGHCFFVPGGPCKKFKISLAQLWVDSNEEFD